MFYNQRLLISGIAILIAFIVMSTPSNSQVWSKVPGTLDYVNFLKFSVHDNNKLYVGSDAVPTNIENNTITFPFFGFGYQVSTDRGVTFSEASLTDYSIFDLIESPSDPSKLLISARKQDIGRVFLSVDAGNTWDEETKRCESSSQVSRFQVAKEGNDEIYYASLLNAANGFRYSDDDFETCSVNPATNISSRDLAISKSNPKVLYLTGDNTSKSRVMCSTDGGETWADRSEGLRSFRILSIQVSPINEAIVIVGADSVTPTGYLTGIGIYYSDDYGVNWRFAGARGALVHDIQFHPTNPKYCVAAGGPSGVLISGTGGDYWEKSLDGLPEGAFARKVAIPNIPPTDDGIVVYASIYGEGIYKSTYITTSVNDNDEFNQARLVNSIYPVPAYDRIVINTNSSVSEISYEIFDVMGNRVIQGNLNTNTQINVASLIQGNYFIKFSNNGTYQLEKFTKID
jgi:hypothetical protein